MADINKVSEEVKGYILEARSLLDGIPDDLDFTWNIDLVIPGNGTGGTLLQPSLLGIGYDPDFEDKDTLSRNLRATVLHECYHAVQGWSNENPTMIPETLLEDGVLEGAATVFEREHGKTTPPWSVYEDDETMLGWLNLVNRQSNDPNSREYFDYKFGEVRGEKWMLYRLGTWIADKSLANNPNLSIADLSSKEAKEIIPLAGLADNPRLHSI